MFGIMAAAALLVAGNIHAQEVATNAPPSNFWSGLDTMKNAIANATNWDAGFGGGRSLNTSGAPITIGFADVVYDFAPQINGTGFSAGLIAGYDVLRRNGADIFNSVSGGLQVQDTISPLAFFGSPALNKFKVTVSVAQLIATPRNGNDVGALTITSASYDVHDFGRFSLMLNGHYEIRAGQGFYSGHYGMASIFLQRNF